MRRKHPYGFWRELRVFMRSQGWNPPIRRRGRCVYLYDTMRIGDAFTQRPKKKKCLILTLKAATQDRELSAGTARMEIIGSTDVCAAIEQRLREDQ